MIMTNDAFFIFNIAADLPVVVSLTVMDQFHFLPQVPLPDPNSDVSLCDNARTKFLIFNSKIQISMQC